MAEQEIDDATFWKKVRKFGSKIPFATDVVAMYFALRDAKTPMRHKAIITAALIYWISPFDLVPDFIVSVGQLDDFTVVAAALLKVRKSVTPEHTQKARNILGLPNKNAEQK